ncbi:2-amino-4-hydroxy-6-hydroxymethyldihydropteridine diphosphokinase [Litoribacillus peritrichatus]|uniref:2-amino-4-hydroxy-6-hydroxymethyldihydropteridine pyrophosphokinase n=1 Tax=Litoribacillus peritrichatus TaxID=718191 RepID=A0ABP7MPP1_9GAMM
MNSAYIGLGSNLESPITQLRSAVAAIQALPQIHSVESSCVYNTTPVGPQDQPDYTNAALKISTSLTAIELLDTLQAIENAHGRVRTLRWGARTLDLDILLFNDEVIDHPRLTVPHREMLNRNFVLIPLADITSTLVFPNGLTLSQAIEQCPENPIQRLKDQTLV